MARLLAEGDAQSGADAGHAKRAHGKILVIGVKLDLHAVRESHLVLLCIRGDGPIHLRPVRKAGGGRPLFCAA